MNVYYLLLLAVIGSVVSIIGGVILLVNDRLAKKVSKISGPFAAGALVSAVLLDLMPEALDTGRDPQMIFMWMVLGIGTFFFLERRLQWFHHHHEHPNQKDSKSLPLMLVVGDTLHNAIDGAAIAFAFLLDPAVGVVTTLAVAFHELPQEIGDFGLMLAAGWSKKKVIVSNLISATATVVAALIVYFIGPSSEGMVGPALALTGGMLLYIALSDVLPSVHDQQPKRKWLDSSNLLFIAGLLVVYASIMVADSMIG